jgi:hypothetical protein
LRSVVYLRLDLHLRLNRKALRRALSTINNARALLTPCMPLLHSHAVVEQTVHFGQVLPTTNAYFARPTRDSSSRVHRHQLVQAARWRKTATILSSRQSWHRDTRNKAVYTLSVRPTSMPHRRYNKHMLYHHASYLARRTSAGSQSCQERDESSALTA